MRGVLAPVSAKFARRELAAVASFDENTLPKDRQRAQVRDLMSGPEAFGVARVAHFGIDGHQSKLSAA